jgi:hypothetical protein
MILNRNNELLSRGPAMDYDILRSLAEAIAGEIVEKEL